MSFQTTRHPGIADPAPATAGDVTTEALSIVSANRYFVIATATLGGAPWASPVYFAHDGLETYWWVSNPGTYHSRLIAANPQIALTIFDSSVAIGSARAVYAEAWAEQVPPDHVARDISHYSRRSEAHGAGPWRPHMVTDPATVRLYRARASSVFVLADNSGPDRRFRVPLTSPTGPIEAQYRRLDAVVADDAGQNLDTTSHHERNHS